MSGARFLEICGSVGVDQNDNRRSDNGSKGLNPPRNRDKESSQHVFSLSSFFRAPSPLSLLYKCQQFDFPMFSGNSEKKHLEPATVFRLVLSCTFSLYHQPVCLRFRTPSCLFRRSGWRFLLRSPVSAHPGVPHWRHRLPDRRGLAARCGNLRE